ncbi:MAG: hypothetical protein ACI4VF_01865 [Lachnospirales bacterium]
MKGKIMSFVTMFVVAICVYGPNIPSGGFSYSPEIPDEVKNLRG